MRGALWRARDIRQREAVRPYYAYQIRWLAADQLIAGRFFMYLRDKGYSCPANRYRSTTAHHTSIRSSAPTLRATKSSIKLMVSKFSGTMSVSSMVSGKVSSRKEIRRNTPKESTTFLVS